jgi:hypothetical protein
MAEFESAADAPAARAVIHATGFDHRIKLIDSILANCTSCEVHDVATASSSAASVAAPAVSFSGPPFGFGTAFAPAEVASSSDNDDDNDESFSSSMPSNVLVFPDRLTGRRVLLALVPLPSSPTASCRRPRSFARKSCTRSSSSRRRRGSSLCNRQK